MSHRLDPAILREYDIRGVVGTSLVAADAWVIGLGFAGMLRDAGLVPGGARPRVVVGYDGRLSSPMLEAALVEGLTAGGVDVVRIGLSTTPMLYYAEACSREEAGSAEQMQGGIQVTGSHNPKDHNGFKLVWGGAPFFGADLQALGDRIAALGPVEVGTGGEGPAFHLAKGGPAMGVAQGQMERREVLVAYADRLLADLRGLDPVALGRLRIGWDAGNGVAGPIIEALTARLPGENHLLFTKVDGHFPHHHPDPTVEANLADLRDLVLSRQLDFGVAFDGDADRLGLVDGLGRVVWGDQILMILAQDLLARQPGALIMADVKASSALFDQITVLGGRALMWKTGHSLIKSGMKAKGALLAGEMTGHLFFAEDWYGFDDAMLAVLRLMAASIRLGASITDLRSAMPEMASTPELRITVAAGQAAGLVAQVREGVARDGLPMDDTDGIRVSTADGWWLLRASNTEAKLSARAEAWNEAALARVLADLDERLAAMGVTRG
ncbi:MAG: phosphomannomutase/phosphoglucomutase [Sphingomonadales bacterium]|nr:phosphomannomutase/phosphoglucomutase [Sphingomonadales bacterium]MDE2172117.1 phosphomannomutase/phosphoglucomutase [Sphingomonadales bacterium]